MTLLYIARKEAITVEEERQQFLDEPHIANPFTLSAQVSPAALILGENARNSQLCLSCALKIEE